MILGSARGRLSRRVGAGFHGSGGVVLLAGSGVVLLAGKGARWSAGVRPGFGRASARAVRIAGRVRSPSDARVSINRENRDTVGSEATGPTPQAGSEACPHPPGGPRPARGRAPHQAGPCPDHVPPAPCATAPTPPISPCPGRPCGSSPQAAHRRRGRPPRGDLDPGRGPSLLARSTLRVSDHLPDALPRESARSGNALAQRREEAVKIPACRVRTDRVDVVA